MELKYTAYSDTKHGAHEKVLVFVGSGKKVLEIGCATGYLSAKMKENGCSVIAVESQREAAEEAKRNGINVIVGDGEELEGLGLEKNSFDVMLFADVLEHMKRPEEALRTVRELLKPGGYVVVSIPNIAYWTQRLKHLMGNWDYTKTGIMDETHLRFYTLKTARELLEKAGYRIIEMDYTPWKPALYFLTKIWPSLLAYQFIFKAGKA